MFYRPSFSTIFHSISKRIIPCLGCRNKRNIIAEVSEAGSGLTLDRPGLSEVAEVVREGNGIYAFVLYEDLGGRFSS